MENNMDDKDKFTQEECLALINGIRDYEWVYNPAHQFYKSKARREMAWEDICSMVGKPAVLCKKKWRHLRDHYIRGHIKRGNTIENWCYYKPLNFLEIVRVKRSPDKTIEEKVDEEDDVFSETDDVQPKRLKTDEENNEISYTFDSSNDTEEFIPDTLTTETTNTENGDDIDAFMNEIAQRIKQLPESLKDVAKVNILAYVTELEIEQSVE